MHTSIRNSNFMDITSFGGDVTKSGDTGDTYMASEITLRGRAALELDTNSEKLLRVGR